MGLHQAGIPGPPFGVKTQNASFGITVSNGHSEEAVLRLLYKEIIRYNSEGVELTYRGGFKDIDFVDPEKVERYRNKPYYEYTPGRFLKVTLIPYDDYSNHGVKMVPVDLHNDDELYRATRAVSAVFEHDIKLINVNYYKYVLGFGSVGDDFDRRDRSEDDDPYCQEVTMEQMQHLLELHNRLLAEGRIDGGFSLVGNCCS